METVDTYEITRGPIGVAKLTTCAGREVFSW